MKKIWICIVVGLLLAIPYRADAFIILDTGHTDEYTFTNPFGVATKFVLDQPATITGIESWLSGVFVRDSNSPDGRLEDSIVRLFVYEDFGIDNSRDLPNTSNMLYYINNPRKLQMTINAKFMALALKEDATAEAIRETFAQAVLENKGYQNPAEAVKKWFASVDPKILDAVTQSGRAVLTSSTAAITAETLHGILQTEVRKRFDKRPETLAPDMVERWEATKTQCEAALADVARQTQNDHERYRKTLLTAINTVYILYNVWLATTATKEQA